MDFFIFKLKIKELW